MRTDMKDTRRRGGRMIILGVATLLALAAPVLAQEDGEEACDGPQNVTALPQDDGSIRVTWDEWSFARAYEVWRAEGDGAFEQVAVTSGDHPETPENEHETEYLDENTTVGVAYAYQIQALGPPPHKSDVCGTATATAIPVFTGFLAAGVATVAGIGAYRLARKG